MSVLKLGMRRSILVMGLCVIVVGFQNCTDVNFENPAKQDESVDAQNIPTAAPNTPSAIEREGGDDVSSTQTSISPVEAAAINVQVFPVLSEWASIAYEDNISSPSGGDRDYNDMVFNFQIKEHFNDDDNMDQIIIKVKIKSHLSGFEHRLYLFADGNPGFYFSNITTLSQQMFIGKASIEVAYPEGNSEKFMKSDDILLVDDTRNSIGLETTVTIDLEEPMKNPREDRITVDFTRYRFIMQNHGEANLGIDTAEINQEDSMIANDSYPFGIVIPVDWDPPSEGQLIDDKYPNFIFYREWLSTGDFETITDNQRLWFLK